MLDFSDVTFNIPFKLDTAERLRNLRIILDYLNKNFKTNILVCEQDATRKFTDVGNFNYMFIPRHDYLMHRTHCLNVMAKQSTTPIIINYDTDVMLPLNQLNQTVTSIRQNVFDMVYPYDGRFIDIVEPYISNAKQLLSVDNLVPQNGNLIHPSSVGGAIAWNKQKFLDGGGENENFISWGWEDNERLHRFKTLGYRIARVNGPIYHLHHPSSANSANTQHKAYFDNENEFKRIISLSKHELQEQIKRWGWTK